MLAYDKNLVTKVTEFMKEVKYQVPDKFVPSNIDPMWVVVVVIAVLALGWAYWQSKRESVGAEK